MPASGRIGTPSYMIVVMPASRGAYMMYEWPTTQPMSEVVNIVSPGSPQKMCFMDAASATAYPPTSRCTPFGCPVVPEVYRMYDGSFDSSHSQATCELAFSSDS